MFKPPSLHQDGWQDTAALLLPADPVPVLHSSHTPSPACADADRAPAAAHTARERCRVPAPPCHRLRACQNTGGPSVPAGPGLRGATELPEGKRSRRAKGCRGEGLCGGERCQAGGEGQTTAPSMLLSSVACEVPGHAGMCSTTQRHGSPARGNGHGCGFLGALGETAPAPSPADEDGYPHWCVPLKPPPSSREVLCPRHCKAMWIETL